MRFTTIQPKRESQLKSEEFIPMAEHVADGEVEEREDDDGISGEGVSEAEDVVVEIGEVEESEGAREGEEVVGEIGGVGEIGDDAEGDGIEGEWDVGDGEGEAGGGGGGGRGGGGGGKVEITAII